MNPDPKSPPITPIIIAAGMSLKLAYAFTSPNLTKPADSIATPYPS